MVGLVTKRAVDAVEDLHRLHAADVLGLQVPVAVAAAPGGDPRREARGLALPLICTTPR
jgi:hypothetical protein